MIKLGDLVRITKKSLFQPDHVTIGTVTRIPVPGNARVTDSMYFVQVGQDPRSRPVAAEDLEELGKKGTPLEEIQAALDKRTAERKQRAEELAQKAAEDTKL